MDETKDQEVEMQHKLLKDYLDFVCTENQIDDKVYIYSGNELETLEKNKNYYDENIETIRKYFIINNYHVIKKAKKRTASILKLMSHQLGYELTRFSKIVWKGRDIKTTTKWMTKIVV